MAGSRLEPSRLDESGGIEQRELRRLASEDRVHDQLAADEAEDVAVARVAACYPDPFVAAGTVKVAVQPPVLLEVIVVGLVVNAEPPKVTVTVLVAL